MTVPAVLIDKSQSPPKPVKFDVYPRKDFQPVEMDPSTLEWLIINEQERPRPDSRIYKVVKQIPDLTDIENYPNHSDAPGVKEYRITYTIEQRSDEEILVNIQGREVAALNKTIPEQKLAKLTLMALGVLFRQLSNQTLTEREKKVKRHVLAAHVALNKNEARLNTIIQSIKDGVIPDPDLLWEETDIVDTVD